MLKIFVNLIHSLLLTVMLLVTSSLTASELSDSSKKLNLLLSEHWKNAQQEQVFFRKDPDTFRMNGKLPSFSQTSRERREAYNLTLLKRLKAIKFKQLTKEEQITYQIFVYERQAEARSYGQLDHLYPFNFYSGFDRYFAGAPDNMSFLDCFS
ncbi:MAG: hypothetical protein COA86_19040 [Kangiella sp.]|nr:MAG: hypothetical protein COA86_19040 [Kangiella sp.]